DGGHVLARLGVADDEPHSFPCHACEIIIGHVARGRRVIKTAVFVLLDENRLARTSGLGGHDGSLAPNRSDFQPPEGPARSTSIIITDAIANKPETWCGESRPDSHKPHALAACP